MSFEDEVEAARAAAAERHHQETEQSVRAADLGRRGRAMLGDLGRDTAAFLTSRRVPPAPRPRRGRLKTVGPGQGGNIRPRETLTTDVPGGWRLGDLVVDVNGVVWSTWMVRVGHLRTDYEMRPAEVLVGHHSYDHRTGPNQQRPICVVHTMPSSEPRLVRYVRDEDDEDVAATFAQACARMAAPT